MKTIYKCSGNKNKILDFKNTCENIIYLRYKKYNCKEKNVK